MCMKLSITKRAYIAGFLDGDGSVYVRIKPNNTYRFRYQVAPSIVFFQSEKMKEKFQEFQQLLGLGTMRRRKDGMLELTVSRIAELETLIEIVKPFVFLKKRQIELLEEIMNAKEHVEKKEDFQAIVKMAETLSKLNYSKRRKTYPFVETTH